MGLVSVNTLKEYLPEVSGTGADTELTNLLARVESDIARWLGFTVYDGGTTPVLTDQTYTLYLDGPEYNDSAILQLPVLPLVSVTSVHSDPDRVYGSSTEVTAAEYVTDLANSRLILKTNVSTEGFSTAFRAIKVVCVAGYTAAPADLEHAICVFCSQLHRAKISQGKARASQRGSSADFSTRSMPLEVREILYPLRSSSVIL